MDTNANIQDLKDLITRLRRGDNKILAEATGYEDTTISNMINGERTMKPDLELAIRKLMNARDEQCDSVIKKNIRRKQKKATEAA